MAAATSVALNVPLKESGATSTVSGTPGMRLTGWVGAESGGGLEYEDRDLAVGLGLILVVVGPHRDGPLPPLRALVAAQLAGGEVALGGRVLDLHERMVDEVAIPGRVLRGTALGGDGGVLAVVLDAHHRVLAQLAGAGPHRGDHDYRH